MRCMNGSASPGTRCTDVALATLHRADGLQALPPGADALLAAGAAESFFHSETWFRLVCRHALPADRAPLFLTASRDGRAMAMLALARSRAAVTGLECPYTCRYAPLFAADVADGDAAALLRSLRAFASVRLDALDPAAPGTALLRAAAVAAGLRVRVFDHFGTWHQAIGAGGWDAYMAARPGPLRSTARRKLARMGRDGGAVEIVSGGDGLEAAIAAYEDVYARSWKSAEPFPDFNPALMRALAGLGKLRLGIYRLAGRPVAAQYWLVEHGQASVLKLAHDDAAKEFSPGTVLTALMLRRLIDADGVSEIDFGRGDDEYKRLWAGQRRQMVGLLLVNPYRVGGLALLARDMAGQVARRIRRGVSGVADQARRSVSARVGLIVSQDNASASLARLRL